jgi:hypothetical protein
MPILICLATLTAALRAQAAPPRADSLLATDTFTIASKALGEPRHINVHTPAGYAGVYSPPGLGVSAPARYPVLYMPDGGLDEDFPHVVRTVDSLIALGKIRPVIVVGIPNTERRRDLTGPTRVKTDSAIAKHVGGSAAFRRFIREELMPAAFPPDPRTLFLASSNVPDIAFPTAHLAQMLQTAQPRGLVWSYSARPDLTHGTIFAGVGPTGLAVALR